MIEEQSQSGRQVSSMPSFETATFSLAENGKTRCGDHCLVRTIGHLVILVVADGVGSRPCDHLASQTTCNELMEAFTKSEGCIPDRVRSAVETAHRMVQNQSRDCEGMLATLVAAVWEIGCDNVYIVSVGDSRMYVASASAISQVSLDDTSAEIYKRFGKPHIESGAAVAFPVITKAIGQTQPLAFEVEEIPFQPGESIILATDGMYHVSSFSDRILATVRTSSLTAGVSQLYRQCNDEFADDATIAILRRNDITEKETYHRVIESSEDYHHHALFGHIICSVLVDMVRESCTNNDLGKSLSCIEYAEKFNVQLLKEDLISLLDIIAVHPQRNLPVARQVFDKLRNMIRRQS